MRPNIYLAKIPEGQDFTIRARLVDAANSVILQAGVTNYSRRIYDLSTIQTAATGSIEFITQASAADFFTMDDGNNTPTVFEFVASSGSGTAGNVEVLIGTTRAETVAALLVAMKARAADPVNLLDIDAAAVDGNTDKLDFTHRRLGQVGNVLLTQSAGSTGRYTLVGMSSALDDAEPLHEVIGGAAADVFQTALTTGSEWTKDRTGYAFEDTVSAAVYSPKGGRRYAVEWNVTVTGGSVVKLRAEVEHDARFS